MAVTRIKIDGDEYQIDTDELTLGEVWTLERDFGISDAGAQTSLGAYLGLLALAVRRRDPSRTEAQAKAFVTGLTNKRIEVVEDEPDPTPAAKGRKAPGEAKRRPASAGSRT